MKRNDIHRPSEIVPADYDFVGFECLKLDGPATCDLLLHYRATIKAHMERTGGTYSQHEHGGNCMVCGNVLATYTALFYHAKTNSYVRMGGDCTEKIYRSDFGMNRFRAAMLDAREAQAGKRKAQALLGDWGYTKAWELYTMDGNLLPRDPRTVVAPRLERGLDGVEYMTEGFEGRLYQEEVTVRDIVGKLVKFGSISEKAQNYIGVLLNKIENRAAMLARQEAEKAAAADCPNGRIVIVGEVVSTREEQGPWGFCVKMLVKHATGYKVWGTMPRGAEFKRGDVVSFKGTVKQSDKDRTFGFFSRPTNPLVTKAAEQAAQ